MLYNAIDFCLFGVFCCFALKPKKKNAAINLRKTETELWSNVTLQVVLCTCTFYFAVISNVTCFGNSTEFGQIDSNSQRVVLCFCLS